jgi:hypothetical protein
VFFDDGVFNAGFVLLANGVAGWNDRVTAATPVVACLP